MYMFAGTPFYATICTISGQQHKFIENKSARKTDFLIFVSQIAPNTVTLSRQERPGADLAPHGSKNHPRLYFSSTANRFPMDLKPI